MAGQPALKSAGPSAFSPASSRSNTPTQATPAPPRGIPITGPPGVVSQSTRATDPYTYWLHFYASKDPKRASPDALHDTIRILNQAGKPRELHAALIGYLRNHPTLAEPWMYEALALAVEMNHGKEEDVKTALNYAADLALRGGNPNALLSAADKLFLKGYYDRVGMLVDRVTEMVQHRFEPILMSIKLAQQTEDPKRLGDSIERLFSLGWPGSDEYFRMEARNQAGLLAKTLIEQNRKPDADALMSRVHEAEARDLYARLTWDGEADYDLNVDEPLGATACFQTPRTVFGGALVKQGYGSHPEEVYTCPRGFSGDYVFRVSRIWANPARPTTRITLEVIEHEGTAQEKKHVVKLDPDKPGQPLTITLKDGRRTRVLPFFDARAAEREILVKEAQKLRAKSRTRPGVAASGSKADAKSRLNSTSGQPNHPPIRLDD